MITQTSRECPLAIALAKCLRASKDELTLHWLDRIKARVSIDTNRVFPTDELLDHVPLLVVGIADFLENSAEPVNVEASVVGKAMELGALRFAQDFDAYEILKEYEILGGILFSYLAHAADEMAEPCEKSELLVCGQRLFQAISVIQQTTTTHFLRLADERIAEREGRLRAFNRSVSHEIKNRIGTVLGASETLRELSGMPAEQQGQFLDIISRNARAMHVTVENLLVLSRMETDTRQHRNVRLPQAANEVNRQVRDMAAAARVYLEIADGLPDVEVNAAAVELCLMNYVANAIKYADPTKARRFARISAAFDETPERGRELVVRVTDNGIGVPEEMRGRLFQRFFRAHETVTETEGTGLGLSIVRETMEALGGRAWAEFGEDGSVFAFSLPSERAADDSLRFAAG